ncbi:YrzI family small protein [Anaerobacillus sp. CMMVII]|nr:YrzI family small protein [Anaerobacillus sp. CMMVII]MCT8139410.1 YrzI family small protein [Anaerobacillus sp. CMMVII]
MVFHFLFFTIKITKRNFSGEQLTRAREAELLEQKFEETKQRFLYTQRLL